MLPWLPGPKAAATSSRAISAPSGSPLASPFAIVTTSGVTPYRSQARNVPVRPIPVCISSATRSVPVSRQSASAPFRNPSGSTRTPLSPWIGSTRKAQAPASSASFRAPRSPNGTVTNPGSIGSNPSWNFGWPVAESPPYVRPWNDPERTTIACGPSGSRPRDHFRTSLIAASFASVPLLQKKTLPPFVAFEIRSPSSAWDGTWNRLETCTSFAACSEMARVTAGWACPRTATAIPPRKSRYRFSRSS